MKKVGVLYGGRSGEHEVSLCSAASVVANLDKTKYEIIPIGIDKDGTWHVQNGINVTNNKEFGEVLELQRTGEWLVNHFENNNKLFLYNKATNQEVTVDIIFPVVHGTFCEDGTLQGLLELAMVPYVGADVSGSVLGIDKDIAKRLLQQSDIPVVPWMTILKQNWLDRKHDILALCNRNFNFPVFVKPCNTGSSVGVKKVLHQEQLEEAIHYAFKFDIKIMIEAAVNAREIECAVLGNEYPRASILGEINPTQEFYSFEAKYVDSDGASLLIPAEISDELASEIQKIALKGYSTLTCTGMARVDFFLDRDSGNFYLNEINTLPGFTNISMYPKLWEKTGVPFAKLLDELIELAVKRHKIKLEVQTEVTSV